METIVHLTTRGVSLAPEEEQLVQAEVERLRQFYGGLVACTVVVSVVNRWPDGRPSAYSFRLALEVAGGELAVTRQAKPTFREALEDAFAAAQRELQDYARRQRGDTKHHATGLRGHVRRLLAYEGYWFITADDGRQIYFSRNAVPDGGFDKLRSEEHTSELQSQR